MIKNKRWIQKAGIKKGALSRQLNIPIQKDIPMRLLDKIVRAKAGDVIINPSKLGKRKIKVTHLLERRAILARNLKRIARHKVQPKKVHKLARKLRERVTRASKKASSAKRVIYRRKRGQRVIKR